MFEIRIREKLDHCDTWSYPDHQRFANFQDAADRASVWIKVLDEQKSAGLLNDYEVIISSKEDY